MESTYEDMRPFEELDEPREWWESGFPVPFPATSSAPSPAPESAAAGGASGRSSRRPSFIRFWSGAGGRRTPSPSPSPWEAAAAEGDEAPPPPPRPPSSSSSSRRWSFARFERPGSRLSRKDDGSAPPSPSPLGDASAEGGGDEDEVPDAGGGDGGGGGGGGGRHFDWASAVARQNSQNSSSGLIAGKRPRKNSIDSAEIVWQPNASVWRRAWSFVLARVGAEWVFLLVLGAFTACLSFVMDICIEALTDRHYEFMELSGSNLGRYALWTLYMLGLMLFSVAFTRYVSTNAVGSGIPEMKTVLKGVELYHYFSFRTLLAKMIGLITALGSGLPLGKEGPFVHVACIVANKMTKLKVFRAIRQNEGRMTEMLGAACAAGVACNFGAPTGAVLFSIEVTSTYYAVRNYWRSFFVATIGAFLFYLLSSAADQATTMEALFRTSFQALPFDTGEIIGFCLLGVGCGLLSAAFVRLFYKVVHWRRDASLRYRWLAQPIYIYPLIVTFVLGTLKFPGLIGEYMGLRPSRVINNLFSEGPLAVTWSASYSYFISLTIYFVFNFVATAVCNTLPVPAGIFLPLFIVGATFGRLFGEIMAKAFPEGVAASNNETTIVPGGYAVVGAAALASGVTRTISTALITVEITGEIKHIMPIIMAVLISNAIANMFTVSVYDTLIELKGLPYLPDLRKGRHYDVCARDIMDRDVPLVTGEMTYMMLQDALDRTDYAMFPVVDDVEHRLLIGSVRRAVLQVVLDKQLTRVRHAALDADRAPSPNGTAEPTATAPATTATEAYDEGPLPQEPGGIQLEAITAKDDEHRHRVRMGGLLTRLRQMAPRRATSRQMSVTSLRHLSRASLHEDTPFLDNWERRLAEQRAQLMSIPIDLRHVRIDASPFQLVERTSLHKVHTLFSLLGLSHAFVTRRGTVLGMITLTGLRREVLGRTDDVLAGTGAAATAAPGERLGRQRPTLPPTTAAALLGPTGENVTSRPLGDERLHFTDDLDDDDGDGDGGDGLGGGGEDGLGGVTASDPGAELQPTLGSVLREHGRERGAWTTTGSTASRSAAGSDEGGGGGGGGDDSTYSASDYDI